MIKGVLFDLDGTLLASDLEEQMGTYFSGLSEYLRTHMPALSATIGPDIMRSSVACAKDRRPNVLVRDKFYESYCAHTGAVIEEIKPVFDTFYQTVYGELGKNYRPVPQILEAIAYLKNQGYRLCVATNPLFPIEAIRWRIQWAGLLPEDFHTITHYGNSHFIKPHKEYYAEAAALLGLAPEECAMVGNNGTEDMAAGALLMPTFLLTEHVLEPGEYKGAQGGYDALFPWLLRL